MNKFVILFFVLFLFSCSREGQSLLMVELCVNDLSKQCPIGVGSPRALMATTFDRQRRNVNFFLEVPDSLYYMEVFQEDTYEKNKLRFFSSMNLNRSYRALSNLIIDMKGVFNVSVKNSLTKDDILFSFDHTWMAESFQSQTYKSMAWKNKRDQVLELNKELPLQVCLESISSECLRLDSVGLNDAYISFYYQVNGSDERFSKFWSDSSALKESYKTEIMKDMDRDALIFFCKDCNISCFCCMMDSIDSRRVSFDISPDEMNLELY